MEKKNIIVAGIIGAGAIIGALLFLIEPSSQTEAGHGEQAAEDFERGPHNGRMLRDGDIAIEMTIFEDGVPPEFHVYPYSGNKPLEPARVALTVELGRLGGVVDRFAFAPENDYLKGQGTVIEPHSFDVKVAARVGNKAHTWSYQSYEGRVEILPAVAEGGGIKTEIAGPYEIKDKVVVTGQIILDPTRSARLRARFPGIVREVRKSVGERVSKGETLILVESNDSLQTYPLKAPIDGVVTAQNASVGESVSDATILEIADVERVVAELAVFPSSVGKLALGQQVVARGLDREQMAEGEITAILPTTAAGSQATLVRAMLENKSQVWRPGMLIEAEITTGSEAVPLAVKVSGIQKFRDFQVVFAKVENTYEVRMLELGKTDGEYVEVLGGLSPGTNYVSENSFLIKADIEKSGASHDH